MSRLGLLDASATITNSSAQVLAADANRTMLMIHNPSNSASVAVNLVGSAAVLNAAGSVTIAPLGTMLFDFGVPTGVITAISSAATSPLTIQYIRGGAGAV